MNTELVERPRGAFGLGLLFAILVANGAAHSVFTIALPVIGRQLGLADVQTGIILTTSAIVMMLAGPVWGWHSERSGRRGAIATGIVTTGLFLLAAAGVVFLRLGVVLSVQATFFLLLGLRLLQAIGVGGVMPASQAYVADATEPEGRARGMGLMGAAFGAGTILGGAAAAGLGQSVAFEGLLGFGALLLVVWWALCSKLPETRQGPELRSDEGLAGLPYGNLWPMLLLTFCALLIYGSLQQVVGLRLQDQFGYSAAEALRATGAVMILTMVTMVAVQVGFLRLFNWHPVRMLQWGCALLIVALLVATMAASYGQLLAGMTLMGFSMGLVFPGNFSLLSLAVDKNSQGRIAGVNGVSKGLGLGLGPITGATLHQFSVVAAFVFALMLAVVMVLVALWISRPVGLMVAGNGTGRV